MVYELRILSGLHRGATLPLDDHELVVGASEEADVVLADPGIAEKHATVLLTDSGWCLSVLDGEIFSADSNRRETLIDLAPGDCARLGDIWMTVTAQDAPWSNPPPMPVDVEFDLIGDAEAEPAAVPEAEVEVAEAAQADNVPASNNGHHAEARRRWSRVVYLPFALIAVLSAAGAYGITASTPDAAIQAETKAGGKRWEDLDDKQEKSPRQDQPAAVKLPPEELRKAFRKRLADADLLQRFDLTLNDEAWHMKAALDDEEAARFERVLASFAKTHDIKFPVHAKVGNAEAMLPFKIRQVISGSDASIVTHDGARLYIGDEYKGVRLVSVSTSKLTFAGKRRIEVAW